MTVVVVVVALITVVIVVAIALVSVGSSVGKTRAAPAQIVVDGVEAIEFCAEALPDHVTAELTYDQLRRAIRLHLEWIQACHWAPEGSGGAPVIFEAFDPLPYMIERAEILGLEVPHHHLEAVIEAHNSYLQVMGAIHLDDPVLVESDLADTPVLDAASPLDRLDTAGPAGTADTAGPAGRVGSTGDDTPLLDGPNSSDGTPTA